MTEQSTCLETIISRIASSTTAFASKYPIPIAATLASTAAAGILYGGYQHLLDRSRQITAREVFASYTASEAGTEIVNTLLGARSTQPGPKVHALCEENRRLLEDLVDSLNPTMSGRDELVLWIALTADEVKEVVRCADDSVNAHRIAVIDRASTGPLARHMRKEYNRYAAAQWGETMYDSES